MSLQIGKQKESIFFWRLCRIESRQLNPYIHIISIEVHLGSHFLNSVLGAEQYFFLVAAPRVRVPGGSPFSQTNRKSASETRDPFRIVINGARKRRIGAEIFFVYVLHGSTGRRIGAEKPWGSTREVLGRIRRTKKRKDIRRCRTKETGRSSKKREGVFLAEVSRYPSESSS